MLVWHSWSSLLQPQSPAWPRKLATFPSPQSSPIGVGQVGHVEEWRHPLQQGTPAFFLAYTLSPRLTLYVVCSLSLSPALSQSHTTLPFSLSSLSCVCLNNTTTNGSTS